MTTPLSLLERLSHSQADAAWDRFIDLYTPLLIHWSRRLKVQNGDVADLLQEVFLHLYRVVPQYRSSKRGHFHGWLYTVFKNVAVAWLRKKQVGPMLIHVDLEALPYELNELEELNDMEYRKYLTERIMQLMKNRFPEETWKACWLSIVEEQPTEIIANQLGMSANMIYLAKSRVLKQIRHELKDLLD